MRSQAAWFLLLLALLTGLISDTGTTEARGDTSSCRAGRQSGSIVTYHTPAAAAPGDVFAVYFVRLNRSLERVQTDAAFLKGPTAPLSMGYEVTEPGHFLVVVQSVSEPLVAVDHAGRLEVRKCGQPAPTPIALQRYDSDTATAAFDLDP